MVREDVKVTNLYDLSLHFYVFHKPIFFFWFFKLRECVWLYRFAIKAKKKKSAVIERAEQSYDIGIDFIFDDFSNWPISIRVSATHPII